MGMTADTVLTNGKVFTEAGAPVAEAVAIWRGRVLAAGSASDIRALAGSGRGSSISAAGWRRPASARRTCIFCRSA